MPDALSITVDAEVIGSQFETISTAKIHIYSINMKSIPKPYPNPIRQRRKKHPKKILKFYIKIDHNFSISHDNNYYYRH